MAVHELIYEFAALSGDAIGIGLRAADEDEARIQWVNPAFTRMYGYEQDEILGKGAGTLLDPKTAQEYYDQIVPQFAAEQRQIVGEAWAMRKDGSTFWASISLVSLPKEPDGSRYSFAIFRDLTSLYEREQAADGLLKDYEQKSMAQERLTAAFNAIEYPIGIWDKDWRLVICNKAFSPRLLGRDTPLAPGTSVKDFLHEAAYSGQFVDAIENEEEWFANALKSFGSGPMRDTTRYTDGRIFRAVGTKGENGDTFIISTDITDVVEAQTKSEDYAAQLEQAKAEAVQQSLLDDLTGLRNRRGLSRALRRLFDHSRTSGSQLAALQIDLDRFKQINDTMGHSVGDQVLRAVSERLISVLSDDMVAARMGGDEFVVLIPHDNGEKPIDFAERLVEVLCRPLIVDGRDVRVGASIGVAQTPLSGETDLLTNADIALYKSKASGRRRVSVFEAIDLQKMRDAKILADDLMRSVENGELTPYFQPQICAQTGAVVALETLVRWQHPSKGLLTPDQFLPVADDINIISAIDDQMFQAAMEQSARLVQRDIGFAFNVSDKRLMGPEILEQAQRAADADCDIAFELLETIYFEETDEVLFRIDALRETGVSVEVDDFGSGRASIVALQRIAPDRMKIDRRLVAPITQSERSRKLLQSIVDIARAMGIGATAEGVESAEHAAILRDMGCDRLQGFHFARPMPFDDLCASFGLRLVDQPAEVAPKVVQIGR